MHYLKKIVGWLLPHVCIFCSEVVVGKQDLCQDCWNELPHLNYFCPCCAKPWPEENQNLLCGVCLKNKQPFDNTYALYRYEAPIAKCIMDLKFGHSLVNANLLGSLLAKKIEANWYRNKSLPQAIIPMPLHPIRLKERGFNQAIEIARPIAKILDIPLVYSACHRLKNTQPQTKLSAKARQMNVKNVFYLTEKLPYRSVAVIDDVITTGATVTEFCYTLKLAGVRKIDVWCCARTEF